MSDSYFTIGQPATVETKVKGSRFIGEVLLVESVEAAQEALQGIRKREYNATHHCYAYIVGRGQKEAFKYSDDGEPSGTAGKPIYDVLLGSGVTNMLCVVTRYFGGTKLGTGGLARAYSEAASLTMAEAGRREHFDTRTYVTTMEFSLYDRWRLQLQALEAEIVDAQFTDRVQLTVRVRISRADQMFRSFTELTSGRGEIEEIQPTEDG